MKTCFRISGGSHEFERMAEDDKDEEVKAPLNNQADDHRKLASTNLSSGSSILFLTDR
jgi:hypothetical protein